MHGPSILTRTMTVARSMPSGGAWQYHSRSDHHSKAACWGILYDLLGQSAVLRKHVESGDVVFGLNHKMSDFKHNRPKKLDLVLARPRSGSAIKKKTFKGLMKKYGILLSAEEKEKLAGYPDVLEGEVGSVQMALEAKACMTAHVAALPRLYDELNSSHETIHASADEALAIGFVMINVAVEFRSPDGDGKELNRHKQPAATETTIAKVHQLPRRTKHGEQGFDALSIVIVDCRNDGSVVKLVTSPPSPKAGDIYEYEMMIRRIAQLYATRFTSL